MNLENGKSGTARRHGTPEKAVGENGADLFLFMGQSNMAGRGAADSAHPERAPELTPDAGYEFRAISDPTRLDPLTEPFGRLENRAGGIDDGSMKTGSLVTAFVNLYYEKTGVPVVGVSASKGGSRIDAWQPGGAFLNDALARLDAADKFLSAHGPRVCHRFMLWCQGESDGDIAKAARQYRAEFERMLDVLHTAGVERCFLIKIGHYNGQAGYDYREIMAAQEEIARENPLVTIVSRSFAEMKARGLMKDEFHYYQKAYNLIGKEAGENTARYRIAADTHCKGGTPQ